MKRTSIFLSFFFIFSFVSLATNLWALGDTKEAQKSNFVPEKNYRVRILDNKGVSIKAERVSMNKQLYLEGMLGELKISIPFAKIAALKIFNTQNSKTLFLLEIQLLSGKNLKLEVAKDTLVAGTVSYGSFEVYLIDLNEIVFLR